MFPSNDSLLRHSLPSPGSHAVRFARLSGTMKCSDSRSPVTPRSLPPRDVTTGRVRSFAPTRANAPHAGLEFDKPVSSRPCPVETTGSLRFLGDLRAYALFLDPGETENARPLRRLGMAPALEYNEGSREAILFRG